MSTIEFPNADGVCSKLAFGTGRLFAGDLANLEKTVRRAYDVGIRHFDSSVGYDSAAPHAAIARLIRDVPGDDIFVSTKIGHIRTTFPEYRNVYRNAEALWGIVHECHRMLLGKIDLLQIHEADLRFWWDDDAPDDAHCFLLPAQSYDFERAPACEVIRRAKSEGVCRYTGITGNSSGALSRVAGAITVDSVMCAYNLDPILRGAADHVAPVARKKELLMMAAGLFQSGAFTRPDRLPEYLARSAAVTRAVSTFSAIQRETGITAVELLCRWALSVECVDKWVVGASGPAQIEQTVAYFRNGPLSRDIQDALDQLAVSGLDWSDLRQAE